MLDRIKRQALTKTIQLSKKRSRRREIFVVIILVVSVYLGFLEMSRFWEQLQLDGDIFITNRLRYPSLSTELRI